MGFVEDMTKSFWCFFLVHSVVSYFSVSLIIFQLLFQLFGFSVSYIVIFISVNFYKKRTKCFIQLTSHQSGLGYGDSVES